MAFPIPELDPDMMATLPSSDFKHLLCSKASLVATVSGSLIDSKLMLDILLPALLCDPGDAG